MAVSQNLTVPNNNNSFTSSLQENESENESPIIGKIVARRDRPETWDDLGDSANLDYYTRTFEANDDVKAIFFVKKYPVFGGIRSQVEDDLNFVLVEDGDNSTGLGIIMIGQPDPIIIYCIMCLRDKKIRKP